jgi:hypothetical protein
MGKKPKTSFARRRIEVPLLVATVWLFSAALVVFVLGLIVLNILVSMGE